MLVLRTSNFQWATIRPIVPRHLYCSLINFFRALVQKQVGLQLNYLQLFEIKAANSKKKTDKNPLQTISNVFQETRLVTEKFSRKSISHPDIFLGRALCADSVSPRMNTILSRDHFKPIRFGENLVVNYKG